MKSEHEKKFQEFLVTPPPPVPDKPGWWWKDTVYGWEPVLVIRSTNGWLEYYDVKKESHYEVVDDGLWGGEAVPPVGKGER